MRPSLRWLSVQLPSISSDQIEFRLCFWGDDGTAFFPPLPAAAGRPRLLYIRGSLLLHPAQLDPLRSTLLQLDPFLVHRARRAGRDDVDCIAPSIPARVPTTMPFLKRLRSRSHATAQEEATDIPAARTEASYDAPPDARSETPPPPFSFPTTYPVGQHNHKDSQGTLFLTRSDVLAHIRLLGAFDRLRKTVEETSAGIAEKLDAPSRWSLFVEVAVYRLELYLRALMATVHDGEPEKVLPPLDVCLVLHSYLVNPL